jgi:hypothetical protein
VTGALTNLAYQQIRSLSKVYGQRFGYHDEAVMLKLLELDESIEISNGQTKVTGVVDVLGVSVMSSLVFGTHF